MYILELKKTHLVQILIILRCENLVSLVNFSKCSRLDKRRQEFNQVKFRNLVFLLNFSRTSSNFFKMIYFAFNSAHLYENILDLILKSNN